MTLGCLGHSCLERNCSMTYGQVPGREKSILQASSEDFSAGRNPFMPIYTWIWRHMGQEKETASCTLRSGTGGPQEKRKTERQGRKNPYFKKETFTEKYSTYKWVPLQGEWYLESSSRKALCCQAFFVNISLLLLALAEVCGNSTFLLLQQLSTLGGKPLPLCC